MADPVAREIEASLSLAWKPAEKGCDEGAPAGASEVVVYMLVASREGELEFDVVGEGDDAACEVAAKGWRRRLRLSLVRLSSIDMRHVM